MRTQLSFEQTRILGALMEKAITTPDQYPLSLNSLTLACNQKSNREPVVNFSEIDCQHILDELDKLGLIMVDRSGRVNRFKHRFCNTEFADIRLTTEQLAIICLLFLRGAQTPGELRTRSQRLCDFSDVSEVEQCLMELSEMATPLVIKLARQAGKREARYMHLYCGEPEESAVESIQTVQVSAPSNPDVLTRLSDLEQQVRELQQQVSELKAQS